MKTSLVIPFFFVWQQKMNNKDRILKDNAPTEAKVEKMRWRQVYKRKLYMAIECFKLYATCFEIKKTLEYIPWNYDQCPQNRDSNWWQDETRKIPPGSQAKTKWNKQVTKKETSAAKNSITLHGSSHILLDRLACLWSQHLRQRQGDQTFENKFKDRLGIIVRSCLKSTNKRKCI